MIKNNIERGGCYWYGNVYLHGVQVRSFYVVDVLLLEVESGPS